MESIVPVVATLSMMFITLILIPGAMMFTLYWAVNIIRKRELSHYAIKTLERRPLQELKVWLNQIGVLEYRGLSKSSGNDIPVFRYPDNLNLMAILGYSLVWQVSTRDLAKLLSSIVHNHMIGIEKVAAEVLRAIPSRRQRTKLYSLMAKTRHKDSAKTLCEEVRQQNKRQKNIDKAAAEDLLIRKGKDIFVPKKSPKPFSD